VLTKQLQVDFTINFIQTRALTRRFRRQGMVGLLPAQVAQLAIEIRSNCHSIIRENGVMPSARLISRPPRNGVERSAPEMARADAAVQQKLEQSARTTGVSKRDNPFVNLLRLVEPNAERFRAWTRQAGIGGANMPPPHGVWGLPPERLEKLPGYGADVEAEREEARKIMGELGYGPNNRLPVKVATRDIAVYRDPAGILVDQLREIYMDAEIEVTETGQWHAKVARRDYMVGLNLTGKGVDDPDANFYENYACDSERNYTDYCNPAIEELFHAQSRELDHEKRLALVHDIDEKLQLDGARPIVTHNVGATCWGADVKGFDTMVNSIYNGWRMEDVWLDR
jgi:ABC-type transport system substrate-binding protein